MKSGVSVYLNQSPQLRGNVARVYSDGSVDITWHKFVLDVPESLMKDSKVDIRAASKRMRVHYAKEDLKHIGVGRPPLG